MVSGWYQSFPWREIIPVSALTLTTPPLHFVISSLYTLRREIVDGWSLKSSLIPPEDWPGFLSRIRCHTAAPAPMLYPALTAYVNAKASASFSIGFVINLAVPTWDKIPVMSWVDVSPPIAAPARTKGICLRMPWIGCPFWPCPISWAKTKASSFSL